MSDSPFANYQYEIYLQGMAGVKPDHPVSWADLEAAAHDALEPGPRGYLFGGASTEDTMRENLAAFRRHRLVPRMLHDVETRSTTRTILGTEMPAPIMLAPVGVQSILHPEGELASARGAATAGLVVHREHRVVLHDGGDRRGRRRRGPVVPALLAARRGPRRKPRQAGRDGGLQGDRRHARHVAPGLAPARPAGGVPALPAGHRDRQLPVGPGVPLDARGPARGRHGRSDRPVRRPVLEPVGDLGRPRVPARADVPAHRPEGHPVGRGRPAGA